MDYINIYKQIISQARLKEKDRICDNVYLEEHHIVPRCMGGLNVASNLVFLTAKEHFICHWLLFKKYRSSDLAYAFYSMVNGPLVKNGKRSLNPSSICFAMQNKHIVGQIQTKRSVIQMRCHLIYQRSGSLFILIDRIKERLYF